MSGQSFEIEGGHPISGTIRPSGNKNAALPLIAACLLPEDEVVLHNVPQIRDVAALLELLAGLGVTVSPRGPSSAATTVGPLRPGISTGTISAVNFPAACAATAR